MNTDRFDRLGPPLVGLILLALAWPVEAQRHRAGRGQAPAPGPQAFSYLEYKRQNHDLIDAEARNSGSGNAWRLSYAASPGLFLFYRDGQVDFGDAGEAGSTGYGFGLVSALQGGARVVLEFERARSEAVAGTVSAGHRSGEYYRLAYQSPTGSQSYLDLAYVRGEFGGTNSNRLELGWYYRLDGRWSLGAALGEDTDADHDRTETGILLRYHY